MPGVAKALPRRCQDAGGHEFTRRVRPHEPERTRARLSDVVLGGDCGMPDVVLGGDGAMPDVVLTPICISPVTRARIT